MQKCFFACESNYTAKFHQFQSLDIDQSVHKIENALSDHKLLVKLSEVDMVVTKARYHY